MIVASLFGVSAGLEVHRITIGESTPIAIEDAWLEMSSYEVKLNQQNDLFRIDRRLIGGKSLTWIGLYREATEINNSRTGGYYGAGLWLYDVVVPGQLVHEILVNLADQIKLLAVSNSKFVKRIADVRGSISMPAQAAALLVKKTAVLTGISPNGPVQSFFTLQNNSISQVLEWAQQSRSAELHSKILIGGADQYIAQQGSHQRPMERFDSLVAADEWSYAMRVNGLNEALKKASTELVAIKNEVGTAVSLQQKIQQAHSGEINNLNAKVADLERQLIAAETNEKRILLAHQAEQRAMHGKMEEVQKRAQQGVSGPRLAEPPVRRQTSQAVSQDKVHPSQFQKNSSSDQSESFLKNWPILLLIVILMTTASVFGTLWMMTLNAKEETVQKNTRLEESLKALQIEKDNSDERLRQNEQTSLAALQKIDTKKDALQDEERFPAENNEICQAGAIKMAQFNYKIVPPNDDRVSRMKIYQFIDKNCKIDEIKMCAKTVKKLKDTFDKEMTMSGKIWLPEKCKIPEPNEFGIKIKRIGQTE